MVASRVLRLKRNRTIRVLGWALCTLLGCTVPLCAAAQSAPETLLVLDLGAAGHGAFLAALRIQLGGVYALRERAPELPGGLPARIAAATEQAGRERALAAVWVEDASVAHGMHTAVLYVVGRRQGRALLEVVQVPSARGPDLPRVLALKLGELLTELRVAQIQPLAPPSVAAASSPPEAASASPGLAEPPPPTAAEAASEATPESGRFWAVGRAGLRLDVAPGHAGSRVGLGAELTPEWTRGRLRLALGVGAAFFPSLTRDSPAGSVELREVAPRVLASLTWQSALCDLGVRSAGVLALVSARGTTPAGRIGDSRQQLLGWALGVQAERTLWGPLGVALFIEAQLQSDHVDFRVNDETLIDRGRVRVMWGLDLRLRTALTPAASGERGLSTRSP